MMKYISIFWLVPRCLLVARKENSTGFSTGLTGRSKNLDPTINPTGRSSRPVPVDPTGFRLWFVAVKRSVLIFNELEQFYVSSTSKKYFFEFTFGKTIKIFEFKLEFPALVQPFFHE